MNSKTLKKITTLTLSFFLFSSIAVAQKNTSKIKEVDYCSLFPNELTNYESETVKTRTLMIYSNVPRVDGGDDYFYSQKCNQGDNFSVVNFASLKTDNEKWKQFFDTLSEKKIYIFEVEFTGKLRTSIIPNFGHLGWSRNEVEVSEINVIKDVSSSVKKPNFEAETDLNDQGKSLQTINLEAVFFFTGNKSSFEINENVGDDFVLIDFEGKKYSKNDYKEFSKDLNKNLENYSSRSVSSGKAKRIGNKFTVEGFIKFSDSQNVEKRVDYENTFVLKNGVWIL
ncbi:MAG TPA: hypothetical protein PKY59_25280, partial [Pyrinomonadaceae bacterium]|nr:hypothetical protein [Pyrinomonadaceae bacterium]